MVITGQRFKINYTHEDCVMFLTESYISYVKNRGMDIIIDKHTKDNISKVSKWITSDLKPGLLLYGGIGNGKTTLAYSLSVMINILYSSALHSERKIVFCKNVLEINDLYEKNRYDFELLKKSELLFIDDLGIEPTYLKIYGKESSPIIDLIYYRYEHNLLTIITTNLDDIAISEKYGERILDRFKEMFDSIYFTNKSYRK